MGIMETSPNIDDWSVRRKRLIHRAHYRGFKEADMILGGFARDHGESLTHDEILMFEDLLGAKDHDIYAWIIQTLPVPANYDTPLLERLRAYRPKVG
jgi:antitoxin CptB